MIRAVTIGVVVSITVLAFWSFSSSITPVPQIGPFSNRLILIRHGEKGPQSVVPPSVDDLVHAHNTNKEDQERHLHRHNDHHRGSSKEHREERKDHKIAHTQDNEEGHERRHRHDKGRKMKTKTSSWWPWPPHGPPSGPPPPGGGKGRGKFPSGLNDAGRQRAQYLRTVFGEKSEFDIGLIFAAPRDLPIETERTYATVAPLALDLGLNVTIDCAETGAPCVAKHVEEFAKTSNQDILIAWKHRDLNVIATALGADNAREHYPDERYDIIWIFENGSITQKRSMHCPELDDGRVDEGDPDLEIEDPSSSSLWSTLKAIWSSFLPAF